jgi:hypothetical protein
MRWSHKLSTYVVWLSCILSRVPKLVSVLSGGRVTFRFVILSSLLSRRNIGKNEKLVKASAQCSSLQRMMEMHY